ncbi:hypothetical protein ABUW04_30335 [Streptacidiphilus sp. N1-10]|uniref:VWA domain-containing protein n=1 Tax=Streptacidiphilus jeojiensis TaxID=3229225 RepID=A0ABV6XX73_9ACTN
MGSGRWSTNVYDAAAEYRAATGADPFDYSSRARAGHRSGWKAHRSLDPRGLTVRESRDSAEHPESLAIAVLFDVTGSMQSVPRVLQTKLPELFGLLLRKGYTQHPQILFGAVGDATCDRVPLQLGQFESDNRMDDHLGNIFLEGGGGGQMTESYELAMYAMARHTSLDCHEKRGRRGYLFLIGDELPYGKVKAREVRAVLGERIQGDIPLTALLPELQQRYDVYYLLPAGTAYSGNRKVLATWRRLLGQNVIELDDLDAVCETIALTVGLGEEAIDLQEGLEDLADIGSTSLETVGKALAAVARRRTGLAVRDASRFHASPLDRGAPGGTDRL